MRFSVKKLLISLGIPLAVGVCAAFLNGDAMRTFSEMNQPPLSPPEWLFPIVWTILYLLMGFASYLVNISEKETERARNLYALQLFFNFLWPTWFFGFEWYLFAFLWLIILWILIFKTQNAFYVISKKAAFLLVPYLIWTTFAGYLNFGVYLLNF